MYFWVFFLFKFFFLSKLSISGLSCFKNINIYTCKKTCIKSLCPLIAWGVCLSGRGRVRYKNAIFFTCSLRENTHIFFFNGRTTKVLPRGGLMAQLSMPPSLPTPSVVRPLKKKSFLCIFPNELIVINMLRQNKTKIWGKMSSKGEKYILVFFFLNQYRNKNFLLHCSLLNYAMG